MDLSRKSQFLPGEHLQVAQELQLALLDELARVVRWRVGDAAFHGGTSIQAAWNSPRWSEDLDFLVGKGRRDALRKAGPTIAANVRVRFAASYPGCTIEFGANAGNPDAQDSMDSWTVKWSHPNRIGKVMVKAEFYATREDILERYRTRLARPQKGNTQISVMMPVAELVSLWADKVKVVATRAGFKWRDAHDLAFVAESLDRNGWPPEDELAEALATTVSIYGKTLEDILEGLRTRLDAGVLDDRKAFQEDMARWFGAEAHTINLGLGVYKQQLERAKAEAAKAEGICTRAIENAAGGPTP